MRAVFTIPPRSKVNPKYFSKITINKEMHPAMFGFQCKGNICHSLHVILSLKSLLFVYRMLWLILNRKTDNLTSRVSLKGSSLKCEISSAVKPAFSSFATGVGFSNNIFVSMFLSTLLEIMILQISNLIFAVVSFILLLVALEFLFPARGDSV